MAASPRARVLRSLVQWFAVELGPATQMRYRDTALSDTRAVLQNRAAVAVVASMTVAASIAASVTSDLPVVAKVILAAVGAGIGTVVILGPIVFLATLAAAPHRQLRASTDFPRCADLSRFDRFRKSGGGGA